jgi:hypothetical protein
MIALAFEENSKSIFENKDIRNKISKVWKKNLQQL